jgi:hypothetical protein
MKTIMRIVAIGIAVAALAGQAHAQVNGADGWLALQEPGMYAFSHPRRNPDTGIGTSGGNRSSTESFAGMVTTGSKPAPKRVARRVNQQPKLGQ